MNAKVVVVVVCACIVAVGLWSWRDQPEAPAADAPAADAPAVDVSAADASAAAALAAVGAAAAGTPSQDPERAPVDHHAHASKSEQVRFDLSVPKEQRVSCGQCDPFKQELAAQFTADEQALLDRAAQFSSYTESEVWRTVAGSPDRMVAFEQVVRPRIREYEAKSLHVFTWREKLGRQLIARGAFERHSPDCPAHLASDPSRFIGRTVSDGVVVYEVATLTPGLSAEYDAALSGRFDAEAQMTSAIDELIRRYHAEDVR